MEEKYSSTFTDYSFVVVGHFFQMHNHPRSMFHSQSTFVVFLCLLRLIPFQSDFLRIGINRGGKNDLAPDQQVHPSCRRSFLLSIQSVDQWTAMQWAFKRTEMGIGLTRMLSTVHHACKVHDIRYFQMEGLVLLPCNQSVAQLTEVASFTVHFIYSNQSTTTSATPLLSLSSIIRGSHREL